MNRILISAPGSGSGKTLITCGLLSYFKRNGKKISAVKCGPDYIDPMFHRKVLGVPSGNLDAFFTSEEKMKEILLRRMAGSELTILEGVMGYYDGLGGVSEKASTYEIAKFTKTPVVLCVDGKGASVSLAAILKGLVEYREDSNVQGIILNRVTSSYYEKMKTFIEQACSVPVLGYVPMLQELQVPSRHLGLCAPEELEAFESWANRLADVLQETIDMERLEAIAKKAPALESQFGEKLQSEVLGQPLDKAQSRRLGELETAKNNHQTVIIAVARDAAFSFYYQENIELLERLGAEIRYFSPLEDSHLPIGTQGLILWGGYPERYAKQLEANTSMRMTIKAALHNGMPCLAECGGFLYLQKELVSEEGQSYAMCGVLSGTGYPTGKLCRFGYLTARQNKQGLVGNLGQELRGHEFHYWDCTDNGDALEIHKTGKVTEQAGIHTDTLFAGFPHFYYESNPGMIRNYLTACRQYVGEVEASEVNALEADVSEVDENEAGALEVNASKELSVRAQAKQNWDRIAKPIDSLGKLENIVTQLCEIYKDPQPPVVTPRALVIFCGDHGVLAEGVTQTDAKVTQIVAENFVQGKSTVNKLAEAAGVDVYTIDIGMKTPRYPKKDLSLDHIVDAKVRQGTGNIYREPAMELEECQNAIEYGKMLTRELKEKGYQLLALGEMGIGNTTPTAVIASLLLQESPEQMTGKGAGLSKEGLARKKQVVEGTVNRILQLLGNSNITKEALLEVLRQGGGFEIAAMVGVFLGAKKEGMPVVLDGAITAVAALCAEVLEPGCKKMMLPSHLPLERSGREALRALGLDPILEGRFCLGEGSGAMFFLPLLDMAIQVYRDMGSFQDYQIEAYERYETFEGN